MSAQKVCSGKMNLHCIVKKNTKCRFIFRLTCVLSSTSASSTASPFFNFAMIWKKKKTVPITWGKGLKAKWNNAEQIRALEAFYVLAKQACLTQHVNRYTYSLQSCDFLVFWVLLSVICNEFHARCVSKTKNQRSAINGQIQMEGSLIPFARLQRGSPRADSTVQHRFLVKAG